MTSGRTITDLCSPTDGHAWNPDFRAVDVENTLGIQGAAMVRAEKSRAQITEASAVPVDHDRPSVCSNAPPKTPPEVRYQSVRLNSGITAAQLLQFERSLPSQTDLDATEDLQTIVSELRRRNQRLKRRLQKCENCLVPLPERALFEVKTVGLNEHQRHELLEILLSFAGGLSQEESGLAIYTNGSARSNGRENKVDHFTISGGQP